MKLRFESKATSGPFNTKQDGEEPPKVEETYSVEAGTLGKITVSATCNDKPAVVNNIVYAFQTLTVDGAGYKPTLSTATAPVLLNGIVGGYENYSIFTLPNPTTQVIGIQAMATGGPCGTWPIEGSIKLEIQTPLSAAPDVAGNSSVGQFEILPPDLDPNENWSFQLQQPGRGGFEYEETLTFQQAGWFGVIQLINATYSTLANEQAEWVPNIINTNGQFVHDNMPDPNPDPVLAKVQVTPRVPVTVAFSDSPGLSDLRSYISIYKPVVGFQVKAAFKTFLMFNPSTDPDPTNDNTTIWYPLGVGASWIAVGEIRWNKVGNPDHLKNWTIKQNSATLRSIEVDAFPTWSDYIHVDIRGGNSPHLIIR